MFKSLGEMLISSESVLEMNVMILQLGGRYIAMRFILLELYFFSSTWTNSIISEETSFISDMWKYRLSLQNIDTPLLEFIERYELKDLYPGMVPLEVSDKYVSNETIMSGKTFH